MQNKDYIINVRVSKETYNKLKRKAKENSESLSELVRKTFSDGMEILGDLKSELFNSNQDGFAHYQHVVVAQDLNCARCDAAIPRGSKAILAETESGEKKYFCGACAASAGA